MAPVPSGSGFTVEKRRDKRVPLRVPIECRSGEVTFQGRAENVSVSGLLIRTETPFSEDEEITVSFVLPDSSRTIQYRARVAHIVPGVFMGVEFVGLAEDSLERITQYVAAARALQAKPK